MLPFKLIKDTPYLALSGELWSVFYEYFNRNWSCYRLYIQGSYTLNLHCVLNAKHEINIKEPVQSHSLYDIKDTVPNAIKGVYTRSFRPVISLH